MKRFTVIGTVMSVISSLIDLIVHLDAHLAVLSSQYGAWLYLLLFLVIFCETGLVVTPFLPGDSLLFAAGSLAAAGYLDITLLCVLLFIAAVLGDAVNFTLGRRGGRWLVSRYPAIFKAEYLDKTHRFYERHGGKTIVLARFAPIVRTFAPFVAGMGDMHYGRFARYNMIGALLWVGLFAVGGFLFGQIPAVRNHLTWILGGIIAISLLPVLWGALRHGVGGKT